MLAIIGGSGLYRLADFQRVRREVVRTPYGETSSPLSIGRFDHGDDFVFLARHGYGHVLAPHRVNYRANIWALNQLGVKKILSISSVGGIDAACTPGRLVVPDQLIDYTSERAHTFFDDNTSEVIHTDFTQPFSQTVRKQILDAAQKIDVNIIETGVYGCTQGPRLETAAEIKRLSRDGCTIVGMTAMPEAILARELDIEYALLCLVSNDAAGCRSSQSTICFEQAKLDLQQAVDSVQNIIKSFII